MSAPDRGKLPGGFTPVVHLRTFYMDAESLTGAEQAAWALGGWAGLRSPWWGDMFQIGLVAYTSQKLYGPDDKDGTRLLASGQNAINVIGEAYASLKVLDQTLTGYRQIIHRPFINAQDNRMVPNAFEALTRAIPRDCALNDRSRVCFGRMRARIRHPGGPASAGKRAGSRLCSTPGADAGRLRCAASSDSSRGIPNGDRARALWGGRGRPRPRAAVPLKRRLVQVLVLPGFRACHGGADL